MKIFDIFKNKKNNSKTYDEALAKTKKEFIPKISNLNIKHNKIDDNYYEELEELLIMSDLSVTFVQEFMKKFKEKIKTNKIKDTKKAKEVIVDELFKMYVEDDILVNKIEYQIAGPTVILLVGVNGTGKTTTIGKLAHLEKAKGKKVLLVAGDTFRAGAVEQLKKWALKTGSMFIGDENKDPASIVYDGLELALKDNVDVVFVDTAGRLQNKVNLMKELEKINKVIHKKVPQAPHETLLIIDATTGQNAIDQAKKFNEITKLTGVILTKLDGTAKGGILLSIKNEAKVPVKFIGTGEKQDDLKVFDIEKYIYGLFKDLI